MGNNLAPRGHEIAWVLLMGRTIFVGFARNSAGPLCGGFHCVIFRPRPHDPLGSDIDPGFAGGVAVKLLRTEEEGVGRHASRVNGVSSDSAVKQQGKQEGAFSRLTRPRHGKIASPKMEGAGKAGCPPHP
jgi:hypothetical protein